MNPKIERIQQLKKEIEQWQNQLPRHSVQASMLIHLEDLEEELAALEKEIGESGED